MIRRRIFLNQFSSGIYVTLTGHGNMGTRGLLGFIIKGVKKGTYNHWDSYPTGLGLAIMRWIQSLSEEDIIKMAGQVEKIEW